MSELEVRERRRLAEARRRAVDPEPSRVASAAWKAANPEMARESARRAQAKRRAANPGAYREARARRVAADPERAAKARRYRLLRDYGIDEVEFARLLATQGGGCAICQTTTPRGIGFCVDHDHETGVVRGILCGPCNTGIGHLGDDLARIRRAVDYLEQGVIR